MNDIYLKIFISVNVPNEEGLIPRKRMVKKTIEEVNEKGKISKIIN